jgi:acyl-CoA thioesterase
MAMQNRVLDDKFAALLGLETLYRAEGESKVEVKLKPEYLNGAGIAHGGFIFTLADYAFALAANKDEESGLAINASINFVKAAMPDDQLTAECKLVSRSKKVGTFITTVTNQNGQVLASVQSLAYFR